MGRMANIGLCERSQLHFLPKHKGQGLNYWLCNYKAQDVRRTFIFIRPSQSTYSHSKSKMLLIFVLGIFISTFFRLAQKLSSPSGNKNNDDNNRTKSLYFAWICKESIFEELMRIRCRSDYRVPDGRKILIIANANSNTSWKKQSFFAMGKNAFEVEIIHMKSVIHSRNDALPVRRFVLKSNENWYSFIENQSFRYRIHCWINYECHTTKPLPRQMRRS